MTIQIEKGEKIRCEEPLAPQSPAGLAPFWVQILRKSIGPVASFYRWEQGMVLRLGGGIWSGCPGCLAPGSSSREKSLFIYTMPSVEMLPLLLFFSGFDCNLCLLHLSLIHISEPTRPKR